MADTMGERETMPFPPELSSLDPENGCWATYGLATLQTASGTHTHKPSASSLPRAQAQDLSGHPHQESAALASLVHPVHLPQGLCPAGSCLEARHTGCPHLP